MKFISIIIFLCSFFWQTGFAKTVIVSDVDDTIKISHVNSYWDSVRYAFSTKSRFKGMNTLYYFLEENSKDEVIFYYLTNAPDWLMGEAHEKFLQNSPFPFGDLILRDEYDDDVHKREWLKRIYQSENPDKIILIGDNGELDPEIYSEFAEQSIVPVSQFIRLAYNKDEGAALKKGQVGFVTPVEIMLEIHKRKWVGTKELARVAQEILHQVIHESFDKEKFEPQFFPNWLDCSLYEWQWTEQTLLAKGETEALKIKLNSVCHTKNKGYAVSQ